MTSCVPLPSGMETHSSPAMIEDTLSHAERSFLQGPLSHWGDCLPTHDMDSLFTGEEEDTYT